jgi:hypothetical protein
MIHNARKRIVNAITDKLKLIDGTGVYSTNISGNAYSKLKFWDEVSDFPSIYLAPGTEHRQYLPGGFKWGFLTVTIKCYTKGEDPAEELENLLSDVEAILDSSNNIVYDINIPGAQTTEITIESIITDEGLLVPYGIGEIVIKVQYQVM